MQTRRIKFDIKAGVSCPYCKIGRIVEKTGRYGRFYSCDTWPSCRFIQQIPEEKDFLEKQADQILKNVL